MTDAEIPYLSAGGFTYDTVDTIILIVFLLGVCLYARFRFPCSTDGAPKTIFRRVFPARKRGLQLTRRGAKVARRLDAEKIARDEMPKLLKLKGISKKATKLDVQVACMEYAMDGLLDSVDKDSRRRIHNEIYHDKHQGILGKENVLVVLAVVFRDAVFRELNIDD